LTATYIQRIGLMGYDFTASDAPAHTRFDESQLRRIFGAEVFEKAAENGHPINIQDLPTIKEVVKDLLKRAHAFFLQVGKSDYTTHFWTQIFGAERVVIMPSTELMPQTQAAIIGLTEGTLDLQQVQEFLQHANVSESDAKKIARSVAGIPIGAQAALPNFSKRPKIGDLFKEKTDPWPIGSTQVAEESSSEATSGDEHGTPGDETVWL